MRGFDLAQEKRVLLANAGGGKSYAANGICTHEHVELSEGLLSVEDKTVTCPLHLSVFSLVDGKPQNPPAELPLMINQTKVEDGYIYTLI